MIQHKSYSKSLELLTHYTFSRYKQKCKQSFWFPQNVECTSFDVRIKVLIEVES